MTEDSTSGGTAPTNAQTPPARPPPPLCPLLQEGEDYDAWVLAGGRLFRAHGSVLASHSAYLRAAVGGEREARLLLPHVPPAGFAAILAYMYTGRLPLTPATLYEVLVAGHLLQMPGVVSLCQALLSSTSATPATAAILGGIPDVPPALSVWRDLARFVPPQHVASTSSSSTIVRPTPTRPRPHHPLKHAHVPPELSCEVEAPENVGSALEDTCPPQHQEGVSAMDTSENYLRSGAAMGETLRGPSGNVIIDIAACDGPVFFERVINRAYKANPLLGHDDSETETEINVEELDSEPGCDNLERETPKPGRDVPVGDLSNSSETSSLANNRDRIDTGGGGGLLSSTRPTSPPVPQNQSSRTYHCVYCNHTFKSHYCYQKHMRRHINPITVEIDKLRGSSLPSPCKPESLQEGNSRTMGVKDVHAPSTGRASSMSPYSSSGTVSPAPSDRLKILDLNVQYFPCKTCGSKFPSYYFVHKHRRLCHQEEENSNPSEKQAKTSSSKPSRTPTPTGGPAVTPKSSATT